MSQDFAITGNTPFTELELSDMGIAQILVTQDYTHVYQMWKGIPVNERTWV